MDRPLSEGKFFGTARSSVPLVLEYASPMEIVKLCPENTQLLSAVAAEVFDNAISSSQLEAFLGCPRHVMVLAVDGGIVVGMASAVEYFHPDKQPQLWINEVGVTPSRRNEGIGRRLIQSLIEIGKARGCAYAWLGTERSNVPAQRCFDSIPNGEYPSEFLLYEWDGLTDHATEPSGEPEPPTDHSGKR